MSKGCRRPRAIRATVAVAALAAACAGSSDAPVPIQIGAPCAFCRMTIVDAKLAGEIVAPGEDPRFYDDIGCLANDLRKRAAPAGAQAYVADHQTGALIEAGRALYTRVENIDTPMGSHVIAHADVASRAADRAVAGRGQLDARAVFGADVLSKRR